MHSFQLRREGAAAVRAHNQTFEHTREGGDRARACRGLRAGTPMPAPIKTAIRDRKMWALGEPYGPSTCTVRGALCPPSTALRSALVQSPSERACTTRFGCSGALLSVNGCHSWRAMLGM